MIDRRTVLQSGLVGAAGAAFGPRLAWAQAATDRRLIIVLQRGAADGLAILAPVGDPALVGARGVLAETAATGLRLDPMFTLHPELKAIGAMFGRGEASFAHAIASNYRERSHFDGQNILESGGLKPYARDDGWLNRLIGLLPPGRNHAVALANAVPLILRGAAPASSYAPSRLPDADADLIDRVTRLYANDADLARLWAEATQTEAMAAGAGSEGARRGAEIGTLVARLMAGADGARIMTVETGGWDTHVQQDARLSTELRGLDAMIAALRTGLGPAWSDTLVMIATEFGRTVAVNGTRGTDHGTGSAAMLLGGRLAQGGKVIADWPGLAPAQLFESRDLRPTQGFERFAAAALAHHYDVDPARMRKTLFPDLI